MIKSINKYIFRVILCAVLAWLPLLSGCQSPSPDGAQILDIRVFLLQGDRQANAAAVEVPLLPGEVTIQYLENTLDEVEDFQARLQTTFGYRDVNLLHLAEVLVVPDQKTHELFLPLGNDHYCRLMLLPEAASVPQSISVSLLRSDPSVYSNAEGLASHFSSFSSQALLSARAELHPGKPLVLGRALSDSTATDIFLMIKPRRLSINDIADLEQLAANRPNLFGIRHRKDQQQLIGQLAAATGVHPDSLTAIFDKDQPTDHASTIAFHELDVRPAIKDMAYPEYPESALVDKIEGKVLCSVIIDTAGRVVTARLEKSSGSAPLDSAAITAARKMTFSPGQKDGIAVRTRVVIPFTFKLSPEDKKKE